MDCKWVPIRSNQDKVCHFLAGVVIAIGFTLLFNPVWGLVAGVISGVAKEVYDQYSYGGADFFDFFATVAGTVTGVMGIGFIEVLIQRFFGH